jgi:hypothetical protein
MPYKLLNEELFSVLLYVQWYDPQDARILSRQLLRTDYSVIDSRREAHARLNRFIDGGVPGFEIFDESVRFPLNRYISDYDSTVARILNALSSVLSFRIDNKAKDVEAGRTTGRQTDANNGANEVKNQAEQDNHKRFEELAGAFSGALSNRDVMWTRRVFERKAWVEWSDPPVGPEPEPEQPQRQEQPEQQEQQQQQDAGGDQHDQGQH